MTEPLQRDVDWLEHHGVKGQKWGVTRKLNKVSSRHQEKKAARQKNRQLNAQSRAKDIKKQDRQIDKAREYINSGKAEGEHFQARQAYKANKAKLGSREAKKILAKADQKFNDNVDIAESVKSGRESTIALVSTLGLISIVGIAGAMNDR